MVARRPEAPRRAEDRTGACAGGPHAVGYAQGYKQYIFHVLWYIPHSDPLDLDRQRLNQRLRCAIGLGEVLDFLMGVDDGGVVFVEKATNGRP